MRTMNNVGTIRANKGHQTRRAKAADKAADDAMLRLSFIEGAERCLQNVIHDCTTFTTAEVIEQNGGVGADSSKFVAYLLRGAERVGAIRSTGTDAWIVVDEDQLYGTDLKRECRIAA